MDPSTIISMVATIAAIGSAAYARAQVKKTRSQLEQASAHDLTDLSNRLNWDLFDRRRYLPSALPSWTGLDDTGWAWRVIHLNHLNLLLLARQDHARGLMSDAELEGWKLKGRYWFRNLWTEQPDLEMRQGRDTLRQVLRSEEGYPKEFRRWLIDSNIVSPDLLSD